VLYEVELAGLLIGRITKSFVLHKHKIDEE